MANELALANDTVLFACAGIESGMPPVSTHGGDAMADATGVNTLIKLDMSLDLVEDRLISDLVSC